MRERYHVVDLFCGAGGLTHGFVLEGFDVRAGYDNDPNCRYPYEINNPGAEFVCKRIEDVRPAEISQWYPDDGFSILAGCAPCQPFSRYTQARKDEAGRWQLVERFGSLACAVRPHVVTMENVPELTRFAKGQVFQQLRDQLEREGYDVWHNPKVFCPDYGIPQRRTRLVLIAARLDLGIGKIELLPARYDAGGYKDVWSAIGHLEPLSAGQTSEHDPLHKAARLSPRNLERIRASKPGGSWSDWDEHLLASCHVRRTGRAYRSVYGRMSWDEPSPTITTQAYGFGSGRFGHPEQDRALSLREAALLQTFPPDYAFVEPDRSVHFRRVGALIGNAVPVDLARVVASSIARALERARTE